MSGDIPTAGLSRSLMLVAPILLLLVGATFGLRCWRRSRLVGDGFGVDDWLMTAGFLGFTSTAVCAFVGGYLNMGTPVHRHNHIGHPDHLLVVLVQFFYALSTAPIRSSLAASCLPYARHRKFYKHGLFAIMGISCATSAAVCVGVMTQIRPFSDLWRSEHAEIYLGWWNYLLAGVSIVLDLALGFLPLLLIWYPAEKMERLSRSPTQLGIQRPNSAQKVADLRRRKQKNAAVLLGLGASASIATVVSIVFTIIFRDIEGLKGRAELTICYLSELSFGIVAGSMPALHGWWGTWWGKGGKGSLKKAPSTRLEQLSEKNRHVGKEVGRGEGEAGDDKAKEAAKDPGTEPQATAEDVSELTLMSEALPVQEDSSEDGVVSGALSVHDDEITPVRVGFGRGAGSASM